MNPRALAILSITVWILIALLASTQAVLLEERLSYDEAAFLREGVESYEGLAKLMEAGLIEEMGLGARETFIVVFKPATLENSRRVEETLASALREFNGRAIGPYSVYKIVVDRVMSELSSRLSSARDQYELLVESGSKARLLYDSLAETLDKTYGLAEAFLAYYLIALESGHPDPALYAYEQLSTTLPAESRILLDLYYEAFNRYKETRDPGEAARLAAIDLARVVAPLLADAVALFDLGNYKDRDRILLYVYNVTVAGTMPLEVFKRLIENPAVVAEEIMASELRKVDDCMAGAFRDMLAGVEASKAVLRCEEYVIRTLAPFPQAIPEEWRATFISRDGSYGLAVGYTEVKLSTEDALRVESLMREELKDVLSELHLYGTVSLKTERMKAIESDAGRVDKIVAFSILATTILLMGTLAAPILIFIVTVIAITVSFGAISIAADYTDVFYLSRLFVLPLVFSITADYSIYYLFRVLEEREKGLNWSEAVITAWKKVAIALAVGGLTGVAGFSAFLLSGHDVLESVGVALVLSVGIAFLASLTLTPAIILLAGEKLIAWPRSKLSIPARRIGSTYRRLASLAIRYKLAIAVASILALALATYAVISIPVTLNVYLGFPSGSEFVKSSEIIFTNFDVSRFSTMLIVVEETGRLEDALRELESSGAISWYRIVSETPLVVEVGVNEDPLGDGARRVLTEIRGVLREHEVKAYVTGISPLLSDAISDIMNAFYTRTIPIALVLVALVIGLLLSSAIQPFRLLVTAVFALMLSILLSASLASLYIDIPDFTEVDSLLYWVIPIILWGFAISSGIDFEAFLTTRIKEEYERVGDIDESVLESIEKTGVVISVLALIYIIAFGSLIVSTIPLLKMIGSAIAIFFLIDAFISRLIVVPAVFSALGKLNWWPSKR